MEISARPETVKEAEKGSLKSATYKLIALTIAGTATAVAAVNAAENSQYAQERQIDKNAELEQAEQIFQRVFREAAPAGGGYAIDLDEIRRGIALHKKWANQYSKPGDVIKSHLVHFKNAHPDLAVIGFDTPETFPYDDVIDKKNMKIILTIPKKETPE